MPKYAGFSVGANFIAFSVPVVPEISAIVEADVRTTQATITWTTDIPASSQIEYGETGAYGSTTTLDETLTTSHSQTILSLTADTLYHYRVVSAADGQTGQSADGTFTTEAEGGAGGTLLVSENFDDQTITLPLRLINGSLQDLSAPGDFTFETPGRGGAGYCAETLGDADARFTVFSSVLSGPPTRFYLSFWMRFASFTSTDPHENMKVFYPHFSPSQSYVHVTMQSGSTLLYGVMHDDVMIYQGGSMNCPDMTDGDWHHYEWYIDLPTRTFRAWYDSVLKADHTFTGDSWSAPWYVSSPGEDAEEAGTWERQVDDWELYDDMPS